MAGAASIRSTTVRSTRVRRGELLGVNLGIVQATRTMELDTGELTGAAIERESDVDQLVPAIGDPVQLRGGPVAERCTAARIEQRSPQPLGASELAGGGAVDTEMHSRPLPSDRPEGGPGSGRR